MRVVLTIPQLGVLDKVASCSVFDGATGGMMTCI